MVELAVPATASIFFKKRPERRLRFVCPEGRNFCLQILSDIDRGSLRRKCDRWPVGQGEIGGSGIKLFGGGRVLNNFQFVGITGWGAGPGEWKRCGKSRHSKLGGVVY